MKGEHAAAIVMLIKAGAVIDYLMSQLPTLRMNTSMQLSRLVAASIAEELASIYATLMALRPRLSGLGVRVKHLVVSFVRHPARQHLLELEERLHAIGAVP